MKLFFSIALVLIAVSKLSASPFVESEWAKTAEEDTYTWTYNTPQTSTASGSFSLKGLFPDSNQGYPVYAWFYLFDDIEFEINRSLVSMDMDESGNVSNIVYAPALTVAYSQILRPDAAVKSLELPVSFGEITADDVVKIDFSANGSTLVYSVYINDTKIDERELLLQYDIVARIPFIKSLYNDISPCITDITLIPEPAAWQFIAVLALGLAAYRRRK